MYSVIATAAVHGIAGMIVKVETDVTNGMPEFEMVGILSSEVKEARARIRAAIRNTGFLLPPKKVYFLCILFIVMPGEGAFLSAYALITDMTSI